MAVTRSFDGAIDLEPRAQAFRRVLSGVAAYVSAIRDGNAAAHEYDRLLQRGVPHQEAVERVLATHFSRR